METTRYAVRCQDCLLVRFVEIDNRVMPFFNIEKELKGAKCKGCDGGVVELMGRVNKANKVEVGEKAVCDARCTNARGPLCDCPCGAKNHGAHAVVPIYKDVKEIGVVETGDALKKAQAIASEWRTSKAKAMSDLQELNEPIKSMWKPRTLYMAGIYLIEAKHMTSHRARMRKLERVREWMAEYKGANNANHKTAV